MTNKERAKARYWRCRDEILAQKKLQYQDRKEDRIAYQTEWNKNNREKTRRYFTTWQRGHPEESRVVCRNRAARKRAAAGSHSATEIKDLAKKQKYRCANPACGVSIRGARHVDHVMPLVLGAVTALKIFNSSVRPAIAVRELNTQTIGPKRQAARRGYR